MEVRVLQKDKLGYFARQKLAGLLGDKLFVQCIKHWEAVKARIESLKGKSSWEILPALVEWEENDRKGRGLPKSVTEK